MAGFIRRYGFFPGIDLITLIEGVIVVDLPPPGTVQGIGEGNAGLVGEFTDVTYGVSVAAGTVSTNPQPVQIFSGQDLINKVGGFDEFLGDFGNSEGNGFVSLRSKTFASLVVVPINNASIQAVRLFRKLPTNTSATVPTPAQPMQAGTVAAGRQFVVAGDRVRTAQMLQFTSKGAYAQGVDGVAAPSGLPALTQVFTSASGAFTTINGGNAVSPGDLLVVGVIGASGAQGTDADTYRVVSVTDATDLVIERQDGSDFASGNWVSGTALAWRIQPATDAETGQGPIATIAAYSVPARPLDASISASTVLTPTVIPPAVSASSWDTLSGLELLSQPSGGVSGGGITFTSAVQAPNAASGSPIDALYTSAITALNTQSAPGNAVNITWSARHSTTIQSQLHTLVDLASEFGVGHIAILAPPLSVQSTAAATAGTAPGVGANRDERVIYTWPGVQVFIPEAVGFTNIKGADGNFYSTGQLDVGTDSWLASLLSNLPPYLNPGQSAPPVPGILAPILGIQRGVPALQIGDYIAMKAAGICGMRIDRTAGPTFQSGITTSLVSGTTKINRRRMADFIEDSLSAALNPFTKLPLTNSLKDAIVGEIDAFLGNLLSINNPPGQQIAGYLIDDVSGNTPDMTAQGIFVVIVKVQTLATADFIVLQAEVGDSVQITQQAA